MDLTGSAQTEESPPMATAPDSTAVSDQILPQQPLVDTTIVVPLLDFRNTKVGDILSALARQYQLNIWIDPYIDKAATIRLENATLNDIFRFFVAEYHLSCERSGALLKITNAPAPIIQRPRIVRCQDSTLSVDVQGLEIGEFIRLLSDSCGINIIPAGSLSGIITGYVKEAVLESGLRAILNSNGFELFSQDGLYKVFHLATAAGGSPIIPGVNIQNGQISLNVINSDLRGLIDNITDRLGLHVFIYGPIEGTVSAKCRGLSAAAAFDYILRGSKYTFALEDSTYFIGPATMTEITISRLVRLKHLMAQGIIELIPEALAAKAVLKLVREQNGLMVTGPLGVVNEIAQYIEQIDYPPAQILIEALVVDYNITNRTEYGIRATSFPLGDSGRPGQRYYPDIDLTGGASELNRDLRYWADKFNITNIGTLPDDFYVRLNALARDGKANVRSRPRIATLNGHEARIDVGTTQYYLLKTETTYGVGQQTPTSQVTEKFQTIEAAMSLTLTPWVNATNEILVTIHPEFNTPQGNFDPNVPPTINHRILDSNVRLHDGETIILGGLIQTSENETVEKFPLLGDIPVLGWLFKNRSKIKTKSELVIYLTPHIYYGAEGAVDISKLQK